MSDVPKSNRFETHSANQDRSRGDLITELAERLGISDDRDTIARNLEDVAAGHINRALVALTTEGGVVGGMEDADVAANATDLPDGVGSGVFDSRPKPGPDEDVQAVVERLEHAEELAANADVDDAEKSGLAATIVANSAEYDTVEAVLEDFPTLPALETKKNRVARGVGVPGRGQTPTFSTTEDDELTDGVEAGVFD